jgi:lycopene elongase/hydratase (dihydrobisanhydrobacterioruberin-forming)
VAEAPGIAQARHPRDVALAWWRLSRPAVWMVSLLPFWTAHVLATRELVPSHHRRELLVATVVIGPFLWASASWVNDACDVDGDRMNPRKADSPLVQGVFSAGAVWRGAVVAALAAVALAVTVNVKFALVVTGALALAWAYSAPPVRLKTRPGADLAANALAVGVVTLLAGWAVTRSPGDFPWYVLPQGLLVASALYVPTTLVDADSDRRSGYRTITTTLGDRRAYFLGWTAWVLSCGGAVLLAALDVLVPRPMLLVFAVTMPVLLWEYHVLIGRARDPAGIVRGIVVCSVTFLASNSLFALMYTGAWEP